jgi:hypothetical protein
MSKYSSYIMGYFDKLIIEQDSPEYKQEIGDEK